MLLQLIQFNQQFNDEKISFSSENNKYFIEFLFLFAFSFCGLCLKCLFNLTNKGVKRGGGGVKGT